MAQQFVNILGVQFEVERVELEGLHGQCFYDQRLIQLDSRYDEQTTAATLLHEVLHAILFQSGQSAAINSESREEGIVRALEHGLTLAGYRRKVKGDG